MTKAEKSGFQVPSFTFKHPSPKCWKAPYSTRTSSRPLKISTLPERTKVKKVATRSRLYKGFFRFLWCSGVLRASDWQQQNKNKKNNRDGLGEQGRNSNSCTQIMFCCLPLLLRQWTWAIHFLSIPTLDSWTIYPWQPPTTIYHRLFLIPCRCSHTHHEMHLRWRLNVQQQHVLKGRTNKKRGP